MHKGWHIAQINVTSFREPHGAPVNDAFEAALAEVNALAAFACRNTTHRAVMRRRREWFVDLPVYLALWRIPAGTTPGLREVKSRLDLLARLGPSAGVFDFKTPFPPPAM